MATHGKTTPIISKLVNLLARRQVKINNRLPENLAERSQPPPSVLGGPSHKLAENYYYTRDGRRSATPPQAIYIGGQKAITAGKGSPAIVPRLPGLGYHEGDGVGYYGSK